MPNPENITNQTREQLQANGRKGAAKTNAILKQRKKMAEELQILLSLPIKKRSVTNKATKILESDKAKAFEEFRNQNTTVQTQLLLKLTQMAMQGNLKAIEFISTIIGENKTIVDVNANAKVDVNKPVDTLADDLFGDDK